MCVKSIVITGGARGIGRALVQHFAKNWQVFVMDIDEKALADLRQNVEENVHLFTGDLANEEDLTQFVDFVLTQSEKIDAFIHDAAIDRKGLLSGASANDLLEVLKVNVVAGYALMAAFQNHFTQDGAAIFLSSTRNHQSMPDNETYVTSKGAILSMVHALANSLAGQVRVNAISPGWIETRDWQVPKEAVVLSREDHAQQLVRRVGVPADIVAMAEFLLDTQKAGFITGQEMIVDGGMSKQMIYHEEFGWTYHE